MKYARLLPSFLLLMLPLPAVRAADPVAPAPNYPPEAYAAVGSDFARVTRLSQLGWNEEQFNAFLDGLRATFRGQPYKLDARAQQLQVEIAKRLNELAEQAMAARLDFSQPGRVQAYMKEMSKQYGLQISDSGLGFVIMPGGTGFRPGPDDTVVFSCEVTCADERTSLPQLTQKELRCKVSDLLPGLVEGLQLLTPKGRGLFVLPPDLSYGTGKWPDGVSPGQPLIYTVTLHEVVAAH